MAEQRYAITTVFLSATDCTHQWRVVDRTGQTGHVTCALRDDAERICALLNGQDAAASAGE